MNDHGPHLEIAGPLVQGEETIASAPLCFTPAALDLLHGTVGRTIPEAGAMLFGPYDRFGVDCVELDVKGSAAASGAVYAPDHAWCSARANAHLDATPLRLWTGVAHSHPAGFTQPSRAAGQARGDLGYVQAVLECNPLMQVFALPILTGCATPRVTLWPWLCERAEDGVAVALAEFRVCAPEEFPPRRFNPAWGAARTPPERPQAGGESARQRPALDVLVLAHALRRPVRCVWRRDTLAITVEREHVRVTVALLPGFPQHAPRVALRVRGRSVPVPLRWSEQSATPAELRLARVVRRAIRLAQEEF